MLKKLAVMLVCCSPWLWACPKDYIECPSGCCYMPQPEGASLEESAKWVSDEKPPRHPEPEWQRMDIKAVDAPMTGDDDRKMDEQKKNAEAVGIANCEKKYGIGQCGQDTGKRP